jgi:glycine cleavage system H protein
MYPENFRYTKEHEWVLVENGVATMGITDHAQKELGDIVYVELPKVGAQVEQGKSFAVVESVKAASEIFAPVTGEVVEANEALSSAPELLNTSPHGDGWIAKIKLSAPEEINRLLSPTDYQAYLGAE